jgi:hypothetical protein
VIYFVEADELLTTDSSGAAGEDERGASAERAGLKNSAEMQQDNDLSSLRDRDDFKKLITELTNGKQAARKPWRSKQTGRLGECRKTFVFPVHSRHRHESDKDFCR